MMVKFKTVTSSGKPAICTIASATCLGSNVASAAMRPSACKAPCICPAAIEVVALP